MQTYTGKNPTRLEAIIAAARASIVTREQPQPAPAAPLLVEAPRPVAQALRPQLQPEAPQRPAQRLTARPTETAPARVLAAPSPAAPSRPLPTLPTAAALRAGVKLSRGAVRLHDLLVRLSGDMARHWRYAVLPDSLTFHIPAVGLAVFLGYDERHLRRLAAELAEVGLIAYGAHAQNVAGRGMWDGTLWAVGLTSTPAHAPYIRREEWTHNWRPDFEADYTGKKGVKAEMSALLTQEGETETAYQALKTRIAVQFTKNPLVGCTPDISQTCDLDSLAADVRGLGSEHHSRRAGTITATATALALALGEPERRAQWAGKLWDALRAHWEGRVGGLEGFACALDRLRTDLAEDAPIRNLGALLMSRLRPDAALATC
ncbi:hypothetical protein [Deinococcus sp. Leaf326]|uniref:hypothetical protein n=1 Tax=Deinococcus sp. Leaf326 TaxID=1736338 RepID=UPI0006FAD8FC|nr:hypothetical protein [Deinococcus sp. Leaf326]KQR07669.1 hypothetical protein ASF71_20915 [Deinococcus sp. Leaf326]